MTICDEKSRHIIDKVQNYLKLHKAANPVDLSEKVKIPRTDIYEVIMPLVGTKFGKFDAMEYDKVKKYLSRDKAEKIIDSTRKQGRPPVFLYLI